MVGGIPFGDVLIRTDLLPFEEIDPAAVISLPADLGSGGAGLDEERGLSGATSARTRLPSPRYSRWSKLSIFAMKIPRPWLSKSRSLQVHKPDAFGDSAHFLAHL
jgi:hypothetical protein